MQSDFETFDLAVPVRDISNMPSLSRFELRLTGKQARAMRRLFDGLVSAGETVDLDRTQRPVTKIPDALRWLLDRVAEATE